MVVLVNMVTYGVDLKIWIVRHIGVVYSSIAESNIGMELSESYSRLILREIVLNSKGVYIWGGDEKIE